MLTERKGELSAPEEFHLNEDDFKHTHSRQLSSNSRASALSFRHISLQPSPREDLVQDVAGMEPGIDSKTTVVEIDNPVGSDIICVDYSSERVKISNVTAPANSFSGIAIKKILKERREWSKVRWINVNGLSWDAIKPILDHYELHPLVVEDMLDIPQRTKVEVFSNYIFACFPFHKLDCNEDRCPSKLSGFLKRVLSFGRAKSQNHNFGPSSSTSSKTDTLYGSATPQGRPLSGKSSFADQSMFTSDRSSSSGESEGACSKPPLYTTRPSSSNSRGNPFRDPRLKEPTLTKNASETTLTQTVYTPTSSSNDISEQLESLPSRTLYQWDRGGSRAGHRSVGQDNLKLLPNIYRKRLVIVEQVSLFLFNNTVITFFEKGSSNIVEPLMCRLLQNHTLLRMSEDSGILAQAIIDACVDHIAPIISEYDGRIKALQADSMTCPDLAHTRALHCLQSDLTILRSTIKPMSSMINAIRSRCKGDSGKGTSDYYEISKSAVLYFGDVADHVLTYVDDLTMMHEQIKQMITLLFNTISIKSSDAVRMLSLVTVVFLPLTFLTGYFGMNFTQFDILNNNVDYYWAIAGPFTAGLALFITYPWAVKKFQSLLRASTY